MALLLEDFLYRCVDAAPLGQQLVQDFRSAGAEQVEALLALLFFAPFAGQKALGLEAPEQGIEGAFVDLQSVLGKSFAQGVAVLLPAQGRQDGENQAAAAEFESEVFKRFWVHRFCTGCCIVCHRHCVIHTVYHTVLNVKNNFRFDARTDRVAENPGCLGGILGNVRKFWKALREEAGAPLGGPKSLCNALNTGEICHFASWAQARWKSQN